MTKCGRYGPTQEHFDYSPQTIRKSVQRSLSRLNTTYLDTVYLHDVEFVCSNPPPAGTHSVALSDKAAEYGLAPEDEGKIFGEGDQRVLNAVIELRKMKQEGLVRNIGITGRSNIINQLVRIQNGDFRLSTSRPPSPCVVSLPRHRRTSGRASQLQPPEPSERHFRSVCTSASRASKNQTAPHCVTD